MIIFLSFDSCLFSKTFLMLLPRFFRHILYLEIRCLPHDAIGNKTKVATSPWMTPTFCTAKCLVEGYSGYAIVNAEYPPQCFCTDDTSLPEPDDTDICSTKCSQNKWMTCGGTKTAGSNVTSLSFIRELQYMNVCTHLLLSHCFLLEIKAIITLSTSF